MTANIDPATNLPQLPEGQRWRVQQPFTGDTTLILQREILCRSERTVNTGPWWNRSRTTEIVTHESWQPIEYIECIATPQGLQRGAEQILARNAEQARIQALAGIYPPKTLEDA